MQKPDVGTLVTAVIMLTAACFPDRHHWQHYLDLLFAFGSGILFVKAFK